VAAYLVVAALVAAGAAVHVQLWRVRRRLGNPSKLALTPAQSRDRRRLAMAVTWAFAGAALLGAVSAQHGYFWITPLVFGLLALGLSRVLKVKLSPELEHQAAIGHVLFAGAKTDPPPADAGPEARMEWLRREWPQIEAGAGKNGVDPKELAALKRKVFGAQADEDRAPSIWDEPSGGWGFGSESK
jgi:hypothetical protein